METLEVTTTSESARGWFDSGVNLFRRARQGDKEAEFDLDLATLFFGIATRMYHELGDPRRTRIVDEWYKSTLIKLGREREYREGWYLEKAKQRI